jgi:hypothetical protein
MHFPNNILYAEMEYTAQGEGTTWINLVTLKLKHQLSLSNSEV